MRKIQFYKVLDAECDFCGRRRKVVTQANNIYICTKCAREVNKHARTNEIVVKNKGGTQND